jgi:hypothetical protein
VEPPVKVKSVTMTKSTAQKSGMQAQEGVHSILTVSPILDMLLNLPMPQFPHLQNGMMIVSTRLNSCGDSSSQSMSGAVFLAQSWM